MRLGVVVAGMHRPALESTAADRLSRFADLGRYVSRIVANLAPVDG